jgi:hypothetical protein
MMRTLLALSCAAMVSLTSANPIAMAQEAQTLKERLSDKASDNQRVDNCRVPVERRGTAPRPDCSVKRTPTPTAETGPSNPR